MIDDTLSDNTAQVGHELVAPDIEVESNQYEVNMGQYQLWVPEFFWGCSESWNYESLPSEGSKTWLRVKQRFIALYSRKFISLVGSCSGYLKVPQQAQFNAVDCWGITLILHLSLTSTRLWYPFIWRVPPLAKHNRVQPFRYPDGIR